MIYIYIYEGILFAPFLYDYKSNNGINTDGRVTISRVTCWGLFGGVWMFDFANMFRFAEFLSFCSRTFISLSEPPIAPTNFLCSDVVQSAPPSFFTQKLLQSAQTSNLRHMFFVPGAFGRTCLIRFILKPIDGTPPHPFTQIRKI